MKKLTIEEFIERARSIHGDKYDYSKVEYTTQNKKILVGCKIHGFYEITANNHLRGKNCIDCVSEFGNRVKKFTKDEILIKCSSIWGNRFDLSKIEYVGIMAKYDIKCNICGKYFNQTLNVCLNNRSNGCPNCQNERGWSRSQWIEFCNKKECLDPMVYIARIYDDNEEFIKIGITSTTINSRLRRIPYNYELIKTLIGSPLFVYNKEIELHRKFVNSRYKPRKHFKGEFECFDLSILDCDSME